MIDKIKKDWQLLLIGILSIVLISVTVLVISKEKEVIVNQEPERVVVGLDDQEIDNFTREEAVESLRTLFVEVLDDEKGRSVEDRLKLLDGDVKYEDILSQKAIDKIYLSDTFGKDEFNKLVTASTILIQSSLVEQNSENEDLAPMITLYDETVYLDEKVMNAFIPLDIFVGATTGYAYEMQYINGEWKLNPYSIIMSMKLSELILGVEE